MLLKPLTKSRLSNRLSGRVSRRAWTLWTTASAPPDDPRPSCRGASRRERVPGGRRRRAREEARRRKTSEMAMGRTPSSFFRAGSRRHEIRWIRASAPRRPQATSSRKAVRAGRRTGSVASGRRSASVQPDRPGAVARAARARSRARTEAGVKEGEGAWSGRGGRGEFKGCEGCRPRSCSMTGGVGGCRPRCSKEAAALRS
jgi:hypothetical protein